MDRNTLAQLLSALYSSTSNDVIRQASSQLNSWQQTVEAWSQADQLLSTPGLQAEFYYFFAQTLKTKIQYDMYQLDTTQLIPLRDSLVKKLLAIEHSSAAKPTRNQLCLAIADLAIQAIESWSSPIADLVTLLQSGHVGALLDILRLIPEETENLKLMTEKSKRNLSRQRCLESYFAVLEFLNMQFVSSQSLEVRNSALACFLGWLRFDSPPIQYSMVDSPILNFCLSELNTISPSKLFVDETAVEIICEIVASSSSFRTRGSQSVLVEQKVFPSVHALCQSLLRADLDEAISADEESMKVITRLIVATGDGMAQSICASYQTDVRIQEYLLTLLKLFSANHLSISDTVAPFLEDFLRQTFSSSPPRGPVPVFHERLLESIIARLDVSSESTFNIQDPFGSIDNEFAQFRSNALLPMLYVMSRDFLGRAAGAEKLVNGLVHNVTNNKSPTLQEAFALALRDQLLHLEEPPQSLQTSVDFLIDNLVSWIDVSTIHSCSLVDAFRRRSFLAMVASLSLWIRSEPQLFKIIDSVAQVLIRPAVVHKSLHFAAAHSFKELCYHRHVRALIVKNPMAMESIARLISQTAGHLDMRAQSDVTEGVTSVLSVCENDELFGALLRDSILGPLVQSVEAAKRAGDATSTACAFDRTTSVMRSLGKLRARTPRYNFVTDLVVNSIWPSVASAMELFRSESDLVEKGCRLIKHCLRCIPDNFKPVVVPLGQLLVRDFSASQHSSYLYMAEVLAQEYGQDADMRQSLSELFASLASDGVRITHQRMGATPFGTDNVDELIEDLYGMIERFMRYAPTIVLQARAGLEAVIGLLVAVFARIRRVETIEAVSAFTENMYGGQWMHAIDVGFVSNDDVATVRNALTQLAPLLVQELVGLLVSVCNRPMRLAIPSLLMVINGFDPNAFRSDWMVRGLQRIPPSIMTDTDKQAALASLVSLDDERTVNNAVEDILYRSELVGRRVRNEDKA